MSRHGIPKDGLYHHQGGGTMCGTAPRADSPYPSDDHWVRADGSEIISESTVEAHFALVPARLVLRSAREVRALPGMGRVVTIPARLSEPKRKKMRDAFFGGDVDRAADTRAPTRSCVACYRAGAEFAASVADDYNSSSSHPYRLGDCILSKMNIRKGKPRRNRPSERLGHKWHSDGPLHFVPLDKVRDGRTGLPITQRPSLCGARIENAGQGTIQPDLVTCPKCSAIIRKKRAAHRRRAASLVRVTR